MSGNVRWVLLLRRALLSALLAAALAPVLAAPAAAWTGFYGGTAQAPKTEAPLRKGGAPESGICVREILRAQLRHGIPDNLLLGIGLQEAGRTHRGELTVWPWAVNAEGEGRIFDTADAALGWIGERRAAGVTSIDVGCLQINLRWHPEAFTSARQGFDPERNADYAARFLKQLYEKTGDWSVAAGSYHSVTPDKQAIYLASLKRNLRVANQRIDSFRAMAQRAPLAQGTATAASAPPAGGAFWSAGAVGAAGAQSRHSIYGTGAIRPILPVFTKGE